MEEDKNKCKKKKKSLSKTNFGLYETTDHRRIGKLILERMVYGWMDK